MKYTCKGHQITNTRKCTQKTVKASRCKSVQTTHHEFQLFFFFFSSTWCVKNKHQDFESSRKTCLCATAAHGGHRGFWFRLLLKTWPYQDFKLSPGLFLKGILISVFLNSIFRKMNLVIEPLIEVILMNQFANTGETHAKGTTQSLPLTDPSSTQPSRAKKSCLPHRIMFSVEFPTWLYLFT